MKPLRSQEGIALVTALMLTLISLTVAMALLYMITQGIRSSGQLKSYRSALDASYGGSELVTKEVLPFIMRGYSSSTMVSDLTGSFSAVNLQVNTTQACLQSKLTRGTANWPAGCDAAPAPAKQPDLTLTLPAVSGSPYRVYSKIVDTSVGNSDVSGLQLEGAGVAEGSTVLTPQHFPYIYRVEIQGERRDNPTAQANLEVLYAY